MLAAVLLLLVQTPTLGSDAEDRARLGQLHGGVRSDTFLLRSLSTALGPPPGQHALRWAIIPPEITTVYNSTLPFSMNDGALWAGRGASVRVRAGLHATWRRFSLVLAPELVSSANQSYALPPDEVELPRPPGRSDYSTPWHVGTYSIDAPLRFGSQSYTRVDPGQSTAAALLGPVSVGVSTENEWWGPGIRNAILLSDNAPGIWRAFVHTARPVRTSIGSFSARWFLGGLFESPYFDTTAANDRRSITALAATWTLPGAPNLTLGVARAVYAPLEQWSDVFGHALDVLRGRGMHTVAGDTIPRPSRDQVFSLFGRWVFPSDGLAVHFEWARNQGPGSLRELLVSPNHTQGYTLGLEWARSAIRMQTELTYLEKSPAYRNEHEETWYTGGASPQGYSQRGQVLGAAIGPGASSQWFTVDYVVPTWRAGMFLGRIRWDNDALYLFPSAYEKRCAHDVSVFAGVRGGTHSRWGDLAATLTFGKRLNVFYHHLTTCDNSADPTQILDLGNTTLEVRFTP
jgi:hypothetical protein